MGLGGGRGVVQRPLSGRQYSAEADEAFEHGRGKKKMEKPHRQRRQRCCPLQPVIDPFDTIKCHDVAFCDTFMSVVVLNNVVASDYHCKLIEHTLHMYLTIKRTLQWETCNLQHPRKN